MVEEKEVIYLVLKFTAIGSNIWRPTLIFSQRYIDFIPRFFSNILFTKKRNISAVRNFFFLNFVTFMKIAILFFCMDMDISMIVLIRKLVYPAYLRVSSEFDRHWLLYIKFELNYFSPKYSIKDLRNS